VRAVLRKYDLPFEAGYIMTRHSGRNDREKRPNAQPLRRDHGRMLPDISGEEVETFLLATIWCSK